MSKHIFLSIIFIVFVFTNKSFSQVECGHFTTNKNLILDSLGITRDIKIFDRFGNEYLPEDIKINEPLNAPAGFVNTSNKCVAGMFTLHFANESNNNYGFGLSQNRNLICNVFKEPVNNFV